MSTKVCLWGLLFVASFTSAELVTGTVTSVHDGDTITLKAEADTKKIRLTGIDAPELKQPFGPESRDALRQSVLNQTVTVNTMKHDRYGRAVDTVLLSGEDINLKQVSVGIAWVYTVYIKELSQEDQVLYPAAEKAANDDRLRLWRDEQPVVPWKYRKSK